MAASPRVELIKRVRLRWYLYALLPLLAVLILAGNGQIPLLFIPVALFLLFFWLFSFGFALYGKARERRKAAK